VFEQVNNCTCEGGAHLGARQALPRGVQLGGCGRDGSFRPCKGRLAGLEGTGSGDAAFDQAGLMSRFVRCRVPTGLGLRKHCPRLIEHVTRRLGLDLGNQRTLFYLIALSDFYAHKSSRNLSAQGGAPIRRRHDRPAKHNLICKRFGLCGYTVDAGCSWLRLGSRALPTSSEQQNRYERQ
jgi:hypothetical protein